jgi:hypothetical protein
MKALKIFGWSLFAGAVVLLLVALFGGYGLFGASAASMMLTIFFVVFLLNAMTVFITEHAIKQSKKDKEEK